MASLRGFEILLIEDSTDLALQIRKVLESAGAWVTDARTARSGIAALEETCPHLVICDLGLIGAGAFLFLTEMKARQDLSRIPVLGLSGPGDKQAILRATSLGASDCLLRPFHAGLLLHKVERVLSAGETFGCRRFGPTEPNPVAELTVPMEIVRVGENGFSVEAPVALGPESEVRLDSALIQQLGCSELLTWSSDSPPRASENGSYINEINLLGADTKTTRAIRSFMREHQLERGSS